MWACGDEAAESLPDALLAGPARANPAQGERLDLQRDRKDYRAFCWVDLGEALPAQKEAGSAG